MCVTDQAVDDLIGDTGTEPGRSAVGVGLAQRAFATPTLGVVEDGEHRRDEQQGDDRERDRDAAASPKERRRAPTPSTTGAMPKTMSGRNNHHIHTAVAPIAPHTTPTVSIRRSSWWPSSFLR
jgi:hypothetical protein